MPDALKQSDLEKCILCDKGVMHSGDPVFYRISMQQFVVDIPAVQRQHGLEQFFHQAPALAGVMGPNDDMAKASSEPQTGLLCASCAFKPISPLMLWGAKAEKSSG